jgi:hypothetical protein
MAHVPTSGDIRQKRARLVRAWRPRVRAARGPLLAALGAGGVAVRTLTRPLLPVAARAGMRGAVEVLEASEQPPAQSVLVSPEPSPDLRGGAGRPGGRVPAHMRAGVYGELAWRGWRMLRRLQAQPGAARVARQARESGGRLSRQAESVADEMHDAVEETLGHAASAPRDARARLRDSFTPPSRRARTSGDHTGTSGDHTGTSGDPGTAEDRDGRGHRPSDPASEGAGHASGGRAAARRAGAWLRRRRRS